jgi:hypothetical protein
MSINDEQAQLVREAGRKPSDEAVIVALNAQWPGGSHDGRFVKADRDNMRRALCAACAIDLAAKGSGE